MEQLRLAWCPEVLVDPERMVEMFHHYVRRGPARLYANGTILTLKEEFDTDAEAAEVFEHLKFVPDFQTHPLKDGNFIVTTNPIAFVVIAADEVDRQVAQLRLNLAGAMFPEEVFFAPSGSPESHHAIGLVGRAKIHQDAFPKQLIARLPKNEV